MLLSSDLEKFIELVAWGGCSAIRCPEYSIVGHTHRDHIPKRLDIVVVGPVAFLKRDEKYKLVVDPDGNRATITVDGIEAKIYVFGKRTLSSYGIDRKLHTYPVMVIVGNECALYIDDFDIGDIEDIKKLITALKSSAKSTLKKFLMPVYGGVSGHGAEDPKELSEASKELMLFAMAEGLEVVALAHKIIPSWVPQSVTRFYKTIETFR